MMDEIGGRPLKGGVGTTRVCLRLRNDLVEALQKIPKGERTAFIESHVEPVLKSLDPGEPCALISKALQIKDMAIDLTFKALSEEKFSDAIGYVCIAKALQDALRPYENLCRSAPETSS